MGQLERWMKERLIERRMEGQTESWQIDGRMSRQIDVKADRRMYTQEDGNIDKLMEVQAECCKFESSDRHSLK